MHHINHIIHHLNHISTKSNHLHLHTCIKRQKMSFLLANLPYMHNIKSRANPEHENILPDMPSSNPLDQYGGRPSYRINVLLATTWKQSTFMGLWLIPNLGI